MGRKHVAGILHSLQLFVVIFFLHRWNCEKHTFDQSAPKTKRLSETERRSNKMAYSFCSYPNTLSANRACFFSLRSYNSKRFGTLMLVTKRFFFFSFYGYSNTLHTFFVTCLLVWHCVSDWLPCSSILGPGIIIERQGLKICQSVKKSVDTPYRQMRPNKNSELCVDLCSNLWQLHQ